jgi:hypothetical protein
VNSWLVVIGDRDALWWVLSEGRMAFPVKRQWRVVSELDAGDALYVYTTRGAFHSPTKDRGRVIATATADGPAGPLDSPFELGGRVFPLGCAITVAELAPWREGVELAPLRGSLSSLPSEPGGYAMALRTPLVRLTTGDARKLSARLQQVTRPPGEVIEGYRR